MNQAQSYLHPLNARHPLLLGTLCVAILLILLIVGLWPFNFHAHNKVAWLPDRDGVHFYGQGIITSAELRNSGPMPLFPDKSITLEMRLRPLQDAILPHILTLYDGKRPDIFIVGQWKSYLLIRSRTDNPAMRKKGKTYGEISLNNVLLKDQDCFLTITSGVGGTALYINGQLMRSFANHRMLDGIAERSVRFVLGNSPTGESYWNGHLTGFAIYNRVLPADQVYSNYQAWTGKTPPLLSADDGCLAIYPFNERKGTTVHNERKGSDVLTISEIFTPVRRKILYPLWSEFRLNLSFVQDITTNMIGFIPFGFFFSVLLMKNTRLKRLSAYLIVTFLGTGLSLTIELIQAYLPTRDSSLTDVVMNSAGTILGIVVYQILSKQAGFRGLDPKALN